MQCNYNSFIQGLFRNALRCRKTGACRIMVPLRYFDCNIVDLYHSFTLRQLGQNVGHGNYAQNEQLVDNIPRIKVNFTVSLKYLLTTY